MGEVRQFSKQHTPVNPSHPFQILYVFFSISIINMVLTFVAYVTLVLSQSTHLLEEEPQVLHDFFF